MNNTLNLALKQVSVKHCLDLKLVEAVYKSYWRFVREHIESLSISELSKEELDAVTTNFNLPYFGKLYVDYDKIIKYKKQLNYYKNAKHKVNKANGSSASGD